MICVCWGITQKGICVVKKTKKEEQRLHALGENIAQIKRLKSYNSFMIVNLRV
jgi:hypothetical protein